MKRIILLVITGLFNVFISGCGNVSLKDAEEIASMEKARSVRNLSKFRTELQNENIKHENKNGEIPVFSLSDDDNKKIRVLNIGDVAKHGDFELQILDSVTADNINDVSKIADENKSLEVKDMLIKAFGPDSRFAKVKGKAYIIEDGSLNSPFESVLFLKVRIKNTGNRSQEMCISPYFYSKADSDEFIYEPDIEIVAMNNIQNDDNDWKFFTFEPGQEEEFVMACVSRKNIGSEELHMSVKFAGSQKDSSNPTSISDGEIFIKVLQGE